MKTACDKHDGAEVTFHGESCPVCESCKLVGDVPPGYVPLNVSAQLAAAWMQIGAAVMGLGTMQGGKVPIGINPLIQHHPEVKVFMKQIEAGIAMAAAAIQQANSRVVRV